MVFHIIGFWICANCVPRTPPGTPIVHRTRPPTDDARSKPFDTANASNEDRRSNGRTARCRLETVALVANGDSRRTPRGARVKRNLRSRRGWVLPNFRPVSVGPAPPFCHRISVTKSNNKSYFLSFSVFCRLLWPIAATTLNEDLHAAFKQQRGGNLCRYDRYKSS